MNNLSQTELEIIFCDEKTYRRAADNKHFTSNLPTEQFQEEVKVLNMSGALQIKGKNIFAV